MDNRSGQKVAPRRERALVDIPALIDWWLGGERDGYAGAASAGHSLSQQAGHGEPRRTFDDETLQFIGIADAKCGNLRLARNGRRADSAHGTASHVTEVTFSRLPMHRRRRN